MALLDGRAAQDISANTTISDTNTGYIQNVTADGKTLTLPAAADGKHIVVRIGGAKIHADGPAGAVSNESVGLTIARGGTDTIKGLGVASGTSVTLAKASSNVGDEIAFQGVGTAWHVVAANGAWVVA